MKKYVKSAGLLRSRLSSTLRPKAKDRSLSEPAGIAPNASTGKRPYSGKPWSVKKYDRIDDLIGNVLAILQEQWLVKD